MLELPLEWNEETFNWRVNLPGEGHSSPVVGGDRLFLTSGDPGLAKQMLFCLDSITGKQLWRQQFDASRYHLHKFNRYTSSSPTTDDKRVYCAWIHENRIQVVALSQVDGEVIWRRDLGTYSSEHGFGASLIVVDDTLIVPNDQMGESFVVALDCETGKTQWKTLRPGGRAAYGAPCVYRGKHGRDQLILNSDRSGMTAYNPSNGDQLWQLADAFPQRCVGSPLVAGGLIIGSCGSGGGGFQLIAVRPPSGPDSEPVVVYTVNRSPPYVPTPVANGELLFLWHDRGTVACLDLQTGKQHWRERVGGNFHASPICFGGNICCISKSGTLILIAAEKTYREIARYDIGQLTSATPVITRNGMMIRTVSSILCVGSEKK